MQDADKQGIASISQVLGTGDGVESKLERLEGALGHVSLEGDVKTNYAQEQQQQKKREETAIATTATTATTPEVPIAETTSEMKKAVDVEETKEEQAREPEGYQMCDMETGLCYWVPVKNKKPIPPAEKEPVKEPVKGEEPVKEPVKEEEPVKEKEPVKEEEPVSAKKEKEGEPEGYQICDMESGLCYWVPAKKDKPTPPADPVDQVPVRSLTPPAPATLAPGPRLVGKLSRERFAMFEKKD